MTYFDVEFDAEKDNGVAVVYLDGPERVNKLSTAAMREFGEVLDELEQNTDIQAAVLYSRKKDSFIVGADIEEFRNFKTPEEVKGLIGEGHELFNRLERLSKPVVAAVHGAAVGGGLELILACTYRLASEHPKTKFALPEVNLGLLPGLGGTQRLPRLVGVQQGLELILTGKNVYAKPAKKMGLVDALMHEPGLLRAGKEAARQLGTGELEPQRDPQSWRDKLLERTPLNRIVYNQAGESVQKRTRGNYPAPPKIIETVRLGQEKGMKAGLQAEADNFASLVFTPESRALIHLFFAKNASEKNPYKDAAKPVEKVGVLGAGLMGSGIAQVSAEGEHEVLLKDMNFEMAAKGKGTIWKDLSKRVGRGRSPFERDLIAERVTPVETYDAFDGVDLVIEAVLEDVNLKQKVLEDVEAVAKKDLVFATNTSSIPIGEVAAQSKRPEQVVGMHYFSPVQKLPLLEIIKTDKTPDWVLGTAFRAGLEQGKTVIVVGDAPGFYTTRILALFMNEALVMLEEGGDIAEIDKAMRDFGFPVGPIKLLDEVGIDVGAKINEVMRPFLEERGVKLSTKGKDVVEAGYKGRKNKQGFYKYEEGKKSKEVNSEIYQFFGSKARKSFGQEVIQERLSLMMINEAVRCLGEGVLSSPKDGDVGAVFGLGFPPFLGGPFWYLDRVGLSEAVTRLERLEGQHGVRFKPADLLKEYAREGRHFYS